MSAVLRDTPAAEAEEIISSSFVLDTLQTALWTVLHGADFEHAVTMAVNMGNDADGGRRGDRARSPAPCTASPPSRRAGWTRSRVRDRVTAVADRLADLVLAG